MRRQEREITAAAHSTIADEDIGDTAVFFDFENIHLGLKNDFNPALILDHLGSRGEVLIRRAYADWGRYSRFQSKLVELGIEMVFLPTYGVSDKNRTDTAVCVDAMEILFTRSNTETFVIVSGDSDFGVLARKLRGYGKRVMGISARNSASKILAAVCHEFIFYESLAGERLQTLRPGDAEQLLRRVLPTIRGSYTTFQPSLLKDRLRNVDSTFSERNYGYQSFLKFIEAFPALFHVERLAGGRIEVSVVEEDSTSDGRRPRAGERKPSRARSEGRGRERAPAREAQPERRRPAERDNRDDEAVEPERTDAGGDSGEGAAAPTESQAATPREPAAAKPKKAAIAAVRTLLRAVIGQFGDEEITLNKLRARMVGNVPNFDHRRLGYPTFTQFLREQPDIVTVLRDGRRFRVKRTA